MPDNTMANETANQQMIARIDTWTRPALAFFFVLFGTLAIVTMAVLDIRSSGNQVADKVFTAILGVAGTWVSTILVFYFSRENFQAAQSSLTAAVNLAQSQAGSKNDANMSVAMAPVDKIKTLELTGADPDASLSLSDLCKLLSSQERPVPILVSGVAKYIVHNASLFRFIADQTLAGTPVTMTGATPTTLKDMTAFTIQNGPNQGKSFGAVLSTFITLPLSATVSTAKTELLKSSGAQDIVVTQTGSPGEKMLGLLTSDDIAQMLST